MDNYVVRKATLDDIEPIIGLIHSSNAKWIGNIRPKYSDKCRIFQNYQNQRLLVLLRGTHTVLAYAEIRNYPAIHALASKGWMKWLSHRYCLDIPISWLNTLFLNFCIYRSEYADCLTILLREAFFCEPRIVYLISVKNPDVQQHAYYVESFDDLAKYAIIYYPRDFDINNNVNTQCLYIIYRFSRLMMNRITYRKALAEDNDDIIDIHKYELPEMHQELGDYYIAEEIMRTDENAHKTFLVVAELVNQSQETETAGFLWLSTDLDLLYLIQHYDLENFGNLVKSDQEDSLYLEELIVSFIQPKADASLFTRDALDDLDATTIFGGLPRYDSGMSVASTAKVQLSSIHGTIVETITPNKFYMRESIYLKLKNIFDKLHNLDYYISEEVKSLNLFYNSGNRSIPPGPKAIENASNVFLLKFIAARKDFPLQRLFSCLGAMFCAYPDRDYCIMLISNTEKLTRTHAEFLKYFIPVAPRPSKLTSLDDLYITHRSTMFGEISLYALEEEDATVIRNMILGSAEPFQSVTSSDASSCSFSYASKINEYAQVEHEWQIVNEIIKDVLFNKLSEFYFYTIRCGNSTKPAKENTIIGFVILRRFYNHHELFYHYHLPKYEDHLTHSRAEIISLKLQPLFHMSSETIFRHLARETNFFDFYFIYSRASDEFTNDLKSMMMLIEANPMKKSSITINLSRHEEYCSGNVDLPKHNFYKDHLIIFRNKLNPPKWFGNTNKLVIIGYGEECKAFLRQLVFQWNSKDHKNSDTYTCLCRVQVTVIYLPGRVEADHDCQFRCPYCADFYNCFMNYRNGSCYVRDATTRMDLRYFVHFVPGIVDTVNREQKFVKLKSSCQIHYDTLILMNAMKYSLRNEVPNPDPYTLNPCNFIQINCRLDKFMLFYKVCVLLEEMPRQHMILVYGSNIETYECISFLLDHGVSPSRLILVRPHIPVLSAEDDKLKNPYRDRNVQFVLDEILDDSGINVYENLQFVQWVEYTDTNFIMEVIFEEYASRKRVLIDCDVFISFDEGIHTNWMTLQWITKAGIEVKNNRIQVNKNYQTNDPHIYAVGQFIEMWDNPNYQYQYTSERELAKKLMYILNIWTKPVGFEYKFSQPTFYQALLPLNYHFTKVTMPRRYMSSTLSSVYSCFMTTYLNNTFCRVSLTNNFIVDEIVVVTKDTTRLDFLEFFCGKHEALLNNLRARYNAHTIPCFLKFFQEPWTELLMHENFDDLQKQNRDILKPIAVSNTLSSQKLSRTAIQDMAQKEFLDINKRVLEQTLLTFLRDHRNDFNHEFALPEDYCQSRNNANTNNCTANEARRKS
ncbi:cilia- and flagella-associated protein 61 [Drosophila willistoni]|uniref:GK21450 n=1 Tax=Drosophila willistoni TaxID=7260 RepID=B4MQB5_DROWI|nr:cilia- and flagella-associated protein 61 [Drosophila willistoni]